MDVSSLSLDAHFDCFIFVFITLGCVISPLCCHYQFAYCVRNDERSTYWIDATDCRLAG